MDDPAGVGYPSLAGTGVICPPIASRGLAGMGIGGDRGGDGGVIPGHPCPRCHRDPSPTRGEISGAVEVAEHAAEEGKKPPEEEVKNQEWDTSASEGGGIHINENGKKQVRKIFSKVINRAKNKNKVCCRNEISHNPTGIDTEMSVKPHVDQQAIPFDNRAIDHYSYKLQKFYGETKTIPVNLWTLRERYSEFRPVLGDGECFYRSFLFSYLEQVLCMQDSHEELHLLAALNEVSILHNSLGWTSEFSRSHKAFKKLIKKVESWRREGIFISEPSTNSYRTKKLLKFFSTYDKTNAIFVFLRLVAAVWICSHRKLYEPHILDLGENCSLKDWCLKHVTTPRTLVDQVEIMALATALKVPLTVEQLTTGPAQDIYVGDGIPRVRVTLLFTGTHYDIIYPIPLSDQSK